MITYMVAVRGIYQNGYVKLDKELSFNNPVEVIVTFLEEDEVPLKKRLMLSDFSFAESQEALKDYKGSFSDTVIEERRNDI